MNLVADDLWILVKAVPVAMMALLPVINPVGTAIVFLSFVGGADPKLTRALARRIALNSVILLTTVLLAGSYILSFFSISIPVVQVSGGLVLAAMGWNLLNKKDSPEAQKQNDTSATSPEALNARAFYPFTFPLTVGPGCLAVTLTLSAHTSHENLTATAISQAGSFLGILAAAIIIFFSLAYAPNLTRKLSQGAAAGLMRIMAFVVLCIGAEICWNGLATLIKQAQLP